MERWEGHYALVTGAGAGMGAAIATALHEAGLKVIGVDKNVQYVRELSSKGITAQACDISNGDEVKGLFNWIDDLFGCTHVLINCAGVLYQGQITDVGTAPVSEDQLMSTLDVNIKGTIRCTRHAVALMKKKDVNGHIININSLAGHYVPFSPEMNVYASSKHAVTAFTGALFNELAHFDSKIKITSISPGMTRTNMAAHIDEGIPALLPKDIADAVLYVLSTPPNVNISELTIQPVAEKRL